MEGNLTAFLSTCASSSRLSVTMRCVGLGLELVFSFSTMSYYNSVLCLFLRQTLSLSCRSLSPPKHGVPPDTSELFSSSISASGFLESAILKYSLSVSPTNAECQYSYCSWLLKRIGGSDPGKRRFLCWTAVRCALVAFSNYYKVDNIIQLHRSVLTLLYQVQKGVSHHFLQIQLALQFDFCCRCYNNIDSSHMNLVQVNWSNLPSLTGTETQLLRSPKNVQEELLLLNAHRHLLHHGVILKGVGECLQYLPSSFSQRALQAQYLALEKDRLAVPEELSSWRKIFEEWVNFKFTTLSSKNSLAEIGTIDSNVSLFESQEMHIVFLENIAEDLLRAIIGKHLKLEDFEKINFQSEPRQKLSITPHSILQFLDMSVPKTLYHFILRKEQLPQQLQMSKQSQYLYSNRELEFAVRQSPAFSSLIKVLLKAVLANMYEFDQAEQKNIMDIVFRYFYLHHAQRQHSAVEMFIICFNKISEAVRYAMTEEFVLFMNVARKIGREKMVEVLLQKSTWLREIYQKTKSNKIIGYKLQGLVPFNRYNFGEEIKIERGKTASRYYQCIDDHSILFLRVSLKELDINFSIMYAGGFGSLQKITFKPICFQKVEKDFLQTIILPQKGIYYIEFDNSGSWVNGKTIRLQRIIMSPLSFQANTRYSFAHDYYLGAEMNAVTKAHLIEYSNNKQQATVQINKSQGKLSFILKRLSRDQELNTYEYETDNELRFEEKLKQVLNPPVFSIYFNGKLVKSLEETKQLVRQPSSSEKTKKEKDVLIEIPLKY